MIEMYHVMSGLEKGHGNIVWELSHLQVRWSHTICRTTKRRYFFTQHFSWVVKLHYLLLWVSKVNIVSEQVGKSSEQLGMLMADWFGKGHWVCVCIASGSGRIWAAGESGDIIGKYHSLYGCLILALYPWHLETGSWIFEWSLNHPIQLFLSFFGSVKPKSSLNSCAVQAQVPSRHFEQEELSVMSFIQI